MDTLRSLTELVESNDLDGVKDVLSRRPEWLDAELFHAAVYSDALDVLAHFVALGWSVDCLDSQGTTPLQTAALSDAHRALTWLLEHGAKVNGVGSGATPISSAAYDGDLWAVQTLVRWGADLDRIFGDPPRTVLDHAAMQGHQEVADYLASVGAKSVWRQEVRPTDLAEHLTRTIGAPEPLALAAFLEGLSIHVIKKPEVTILVTEGLADTEMTPPDGDDEHRRGELMLLLPPEWPLGRPLLEDPAYRWPVDWMRRIAIAVQGGMWLGALGEPVFIANQEPPEPLGPNTRLACWFIFIDGSEASRFVAPDGSVIHLYTLFPTYPEERALEQAQGLVPLMQRWDSLGIDFIVRPTRPSALGP